MRKGGNLWKEAQFRAFDSLECYFYDHWKAKQDSSPNVHLSQVLLWLDYFWFILRKNWIGKENAKHYLELPKKYLSFFLFSFCHSIFVTNALWKVIDSNLIGELLFKSKTELVGNEGVQNTQHYVEVLEKRRCIPAAC